jgi:hypothetical protein
MSDSDRGRRTADAAPKIDPKQAALHVDLSHVENALSGGRDGDVRSVGAAVSHLVRVLKRHHTPDAEAAAEAAAVEAEAAAAAAAARQAAIAAGTEPAPALFQPPAAATA